jgi:hypothetical protein
VRGVVGATVLREENGEVALRVQARPDLRPAIVRAIVAHGLDLLRIDRSASRLESIFIKLAGTREGANGVSEGRPS